MGDRKRKTGIKGKKGKERSLRLDKRRMDFFWGRVIVSHEHEEKKRGRVILIGWRRGNTALMAQGVEKDGEKRSEVRLISTRSSAKRTSLHG